MTYAIHASKNGQSVVTVRISPEAAVDKAGLLELLGWNVHITDMAGRHSACQTLIRFFGAIERPCNKRYKFDEKPSVNRPEAADPQWVLRVSLRRRDRRLFRPTHARSLSAFGSRPVFSDV